MVTVDVSCAASTVCDSDKHPLFVFFLRLKAGESREGDFVEINNPCYDTQHYEIALIQFATRHEQPCTHDAHFRKPNADQQKWLDSVKVKEREGGNLAWSI